MSFWQEPLAMGASHVGKGTSATSWPLTESEGNTLVNTSQKLAKPATGPIKSQVADNCQLWQSAKRSPQSWRE
jgi:hypothetical protein